MSWSKVKLGEVCDVRRGTTITEKQALVGKIPVVAGGLTFSYTHNTANRTGAVITVSGSGANAGYVNFWNTPIFASDCSTVQPKCAAIDIKYVYFYLKHKQNFINTTMRSGAAQPHVYAKDIALLEVPLPPLAEQKRIAEILDKAAEIKAKREHTIAKLDVLAQSTFVEMFGEDKWRKVSIAEVTEQVQNCSPENKFIKEFTYIDIGAIDNITKKIINPRLLNKDDAPSRAKQLIEKDDILVSTVRPNLNAVARVECEYLNAVASTGFCVLRCKQDLVLPAYIFAIVKSTKFVNEMIRLATGASYPAVNDKIISQYCIPLPPIAMQRTFTEKIKALQTYAATSVKHDEKLIGLTASLQHQAFTTGFAA